MEYKAEVLSYLIKQKLLIFINLWHLCLKRLAGANFMNINGLRIWKLKCLNFTAICHHNLGFSPLVKFVSVSSWQDLVSKYCDIFYIISWFINSPWWHFLIKLNSISSNTVSFLEFTVIYFTKKSWHQRTSVIPRQNEKLQDWTFKKLLQS